MDAQGGDFFVTHPDPAQFFNPPGCDSKPGNKADHGFFQMPYITGNAEMVQPDVENRIDDQLTGAVVRDVSAPVGQNDFDLSFLENLGSEEILDLPRLAYGDDRRMLEKQKDILDFLPNPRLGQSVLQGKGFFIIDQAEAERAAGMNGRMDLIHKIYISSGWVGVKITRKKICSVKMGDTLILRESERMRIGGPGQGFACTMRRLFPPYSESRFTFSGQSTREI